MKHERYEPLEQYKLELEESTDFWEISVVMDSENAEDFESKVGSILKWDAFDKQEHMNYASYGFTKRDFSRYIAKILKNVPYTYEIEDY